MPHALIVIANPVAAANRPTFRPKVLISMTFSSFGPLCLGAFKGKGVSFGLTTGEFGTNAYGNDDLASTTSGGFARMEDQAQRPNPWVKRRESFEFTTILSLKKSLVLALARSEYAN